MSGLPPERSGPPQPISALPAAPPKPHRQPFYFQTHTTWIKHFKSRNFKMACSQGTPPANTRQYFDFSRPEGAPRGTELPRADQAADWDRDEVAGSAGQEVREVRAASRPGRRRRRGQPRLTNGVPTCVVGSSITRSRWHFARCIYAHRHGRHVDVFWNVGWTRMLQTDISEFQNEAAGYTKTERC